MDEMPCVKCDKNKTHTFQLEKGKKKQEISKYWVAGVSAIRFLTR